jgi:hypothetical protein
MSDPRYTDSYRDNPSGGDDQAGLWSWLAPHVATLGLLTGSIIRIQLIARVRGALKCARLQQLVRLHHIRLEILMELSETEKRLPGGRSFSRDLTFAEVIRTNGHDEMVRVPPTCSSLSGLQTARRPAAEMKKGRLVPTPCSCLMDCC